MTKFIVLNMILAMTMATSYHPYAEDVQEVQTEAAVEEGVQNTIDWDNFHIKVGGKDMHFPFPVSEVIEAGWESEDMDDFNSTRIDPLDMGYFYAVNGDNRIYLYIANESFERMPAPECDIAGVYINSYDFDFKNTSVTIMDSVEAGTGTIDSVREAFGTEDFSYEDVDDEGASVMVYQYSDGDFRCLVLYADIDTGVINAFLYTDDSMTDELEANVEVDPSSSVTEYVKPESVGDTFKDYRIKLDGDTYTLPVPVMTLVADGWEVEEDMLYAIVAPGYSRMVHFTKGDYKFAADAYNDTDKAAPVINCWIGQIDLGGFVGDGNIPWELPAGIHKGMTRDELVATLSKLGMHEDAEESNDNMTYLIDSSDNWIFEDGGVEFNDDLEELGVADRFDEFLVFPEDWNQMYQIRVYTGNKPSFTKDSVIGVGVINYPKDIFDNFG